MAMGKVAAASIGAAVGIAAVVDTFTGSNMADSVKDFYSANPVAAGVATAAGLDIVACLASERVRHANAYVAKGVGRAARGLYRNVRHHPRGWGIGLAATVAAGALALGIVSARNYSSLERTVASQQTQIDDIELKEGPQGKQGVPGPQGERGYSERGPQGPQGIQGPAGKDGEMRTVYITVTPTPTPTSTATPTPKPTVTPTPTPYKLSGTFTVSYDALKSIVGRDGGNFSRASGVGIETLVDLFDGETGRIVRNGVQTFDPEARNPALAVTASTVTFNFDSGGRQLTTDRSAFRNTLVDYLERNTTAAERAGIALSAN